MDPASSGRSWLAFRALLAVGLTVSFYTLSIGLALGLLWAACWMLGSKGRVQGYALVACVIGGLSILWGVFPRWERFTPPGPRLTEETQPRLFRLLRSVAEATGQAMPAEVYLAFDVNAWVAQRGGILGFWGRRVMGLGLPLMAALNLAEFRGVIAHEFGHFHGGETRLGPWIHRTSTAIGRTIQTLTEAGSVLRFLFVWYANAFHRITFAISRRQELLADRLAAGVAGAPALASGLRRTAGAAAAFQAYFGSEVVPLLSSGFRPPMAEGFQRFLGARPIAASIDQVVEGMVREEKVDPFDSHPPLRARLEALGNPASPAPATSEPSAATLLEKLEEFESSLLAAAFPAAKIPPPLPWDDAAARVYLPMWRTHVRENRELLAGLTPEGLPAALSRPPGNPRWKRRGASEPPKGPPKVAGLGATALMLHMAELGWEVRCEPGREVALRRGDEAFFPFQEVADLVAGTTTANGWTERCRMLGVEGLLLETAPAPEAPNP